MYGVEGIWYSTVQVCPNGVSFEPESLCQGGRTEVPGHHQHQCGGGEQPYVLCILSPVLTEVLLYRIVVSDVPGHFGVLYYLGSVDWQYKLFKLRNDEDLSEGACARV